MNPKYDDFNFRKIAQINSLLNNYTKFLPNAPIFLENFIFTDLVKNIFEKSYTSMSHYNFDEEFKQFRKQVDYLTRKYTELLKRNNTIPTTCFYTSVQFKDVNNKVNPNDPYKRTVDHRVPVIEMFLTRKTPEETAAAENIVFCLRIVNSYKSSSPEEYFVEKIVPYIKEKL